MLGQRSWFCKLPWEASHRLKPFWYACRGKLGTISNFHPLTFNLASKVKCQLKAYGPVHPDANSEGIRYPDVISGQYPVVRPLTRNLTLKLTLKDKLKVIFLFSVLNLTLERGLEEIRIRM